MLATDRFKYDMIIIIIIIIRFVKRQNVKRLPWRCHNILIARGFHHAYNLAAIFIFAVIEHWLIQHSINCEPFSI